MDEPTNGIDLISPMDKFRVVENQIKIVTENSPKKQKNANTPNTADFLR